MHPLQEMQGDCLRQCGQVRTGLHGAQEQCVLDQRVLQHQQLQQGTHVLLLVQSCLVLSCQEHPVQGQLVLHQRVLMY